MKRWIALVAVVLCGCQDSPSGPELGQPMSVASAATRAVSIGCDCNGFKNHGQYVSCVTKAANDLNKAGTITGAEKGCITSKAAQSQCGQTPGAATPNFMSCLVAGTPTPTPTPGPSPTPSPGPSPTPTPSPSPTPTTDCDDIEFSQVELDGAVEAALVQGVHPWNDPERFIQIVENELQCSLGSDLPSAVTKAHLAQYNDQTDYCGKGQSRNFKVHGDINFPCYLHDRCYTHCGVPADGGSFPLGCSWSIATDTCDEQLADSCAAVTVTSNYNNRTLLICSAVRRLWPTTRGACAEMPNTCGTPYITALDPSSSSACDCPQLLEISGYDFEQGAEVILRVPATGEEFPNCCNADGGQPEYVEGGEGFVTLVRVNPFYTTVPDLWNAQIRNPDGAESNVVDFQVVAGTCACTSLQGFAESAGPVGGRLRKQIGNEGLERLLRRYGIRSKSQ